MDQSLAGTDAQWLRRSFAVAEKTVEAGDYPFGAVLVNAQGQMLLESGNTVGTTTDRLGHAELLVLLEAGRTWPLEELATFTLYSSTEPCPMCTGAVAWSLGRLVYGLSHARMYELFAATQEAPPRFIEPWNCRPLLEQLHPPMKMVGPMLEDEAAAAHWMWLERWTGGVTEV